MRLLGYVKSTGNRSQDQGYHNDTNFQKLPLYVNQSESCHYNSTYVPRSLSLLSIQVQSH